VKRIHEIDLSEGRLLPKLIAFALPVMLSGILQLAFNAADLIVVGRFTGEVALAAVGSNGALVSLVVNVLIGLGTGASVLTARYFGAKDAQRMSETVQTAAIVGVAGGALFALIGFVLSEPLLRIMGTPQEVLELASVYLRIYFLGLPFLAVYNFLSAVLRSVGDTRRPLLYMAIAGVVNVLLNLCLVVFFRLGVVGVALATVISEELSCVLTVRCLMRCEGSYRLPRGRLRFSGRVFLQMLHIGLPAGIQGSLFSISNVIIQSSINSFGAAAIAGNAAAGSLESFAFCSQDAVSQAAVASVSQCMGARRYERVKSAVLACSLLEVLVSVVIYGLMILFRYPLLRIYTDDQAAIDAAVIRIFILGVLYFTNGIMNAMTSVIRGHGYSVLPTVLTLVGVCGFRLIWIFTVFAGHHDLRILYSCYPISWIITCTAQYITYFSIRNKAIVKNEEQYRREHPQPQAD
jgi:putative MATE family efflux protein